MTPLCVATARVAFLKQRAEFHRREVARILPRLCAVENEREDNMMEVIQFGATKRLLTRGSPHENSPCNLG
jgi:hypothetical protein